VGLALLAGCVGAFCSKVRPQNCNAKLRHLDNTLTPKHTAKEETCVRAVAETALSKLLTAWVAALTILVFMIDAGGWTERNEQILD
jgi:hypothetical protein